MSETKENTALAGRNNAIVRHTGIQFLANIVDSHIQGKVGAGECWLCGGYAINGHMLRDVIPETLTNHNKSACPNSEIVCEACAGLTSKKTWDAYVANHPDMGLKTGYATGWRNYSHAAWGDHHECPKRERWRELLLSPPETPFVFCMAISSQKQILFMSKISYSRDKFWLQFEDESLLIDRSILIKVFEPFEKLYSIGFSKDAIFSGTYNTKAILKNGMTEWKELESKMRVFRVSNINELRVVHFCAQKQED